MQTGLKILVIALLIFFSIVFLLQMGVEVLTWRALVVLVALIAAGYLMARTKFL
jgi:hypothetical protein